MTKRTWLALALAGLVAASGAIGGTALAQQTPQDGKLTYTATLVAPVSRLPATRSTLPLRVVIDRFSTDDEVEHLVDLYTTRGDEALAEALSEDTLGWIHIGATFQVPISFATRIEDEAGDRIVVIARRPISFGEIFRGSRTRDYPYTAIELDVGGDGRGTGELIAFAQFRPHPDGTIELENYEFVAARLMGVQRAKGG